MSIPEHYRREIERYRENCLLCGLCAQACPILPHTEAADVDAREIQTRVLACVNSGEANPLARTKALACMACFKCTADTCPEDLDPMLVNEVIKGRIIGRGQAPPCIGNAGAPDSVHRVLARIQLSAADYARITATSARRRVRVVFFPGCNVYFQPEKILSALDVLAALQEDFAFLPGLDHCCGERFFFEGEVASGAHLAKTLVDAVAALRPETLVLWCPTCQCRFARTLSPSLAMPFEVVSFPQYLAANMDRLPLSTAAAGTVTLHEACKSAYTGIGRDGPREVLRRLPGVELIEMAHHGPDTVCCGSGAACWYPESSARMRRDRLEEAAGSGAERLVTVCHYCSQALAADARHHDFEIASYIDLVAAALGRPREDKFQRYMRWGDPERILQDAADNIAGAPFPRKRIVEVLRSIFLD